MSSSMPWVKLYTELLDDTKIGKLPDIAKLRFIQLLLLAGECDADGYLLNGDAALTVDEIAWRLRVDAKILSEDIGLLQNAGMVACEEGAFVIRNFIKRQGRSQEEKREQWRDRQRKKRSSSQPDSVTDESRVTHAPREDKSREEEIESREEKISDSGESTAQNNPAPSKKGTDARSSHPAIKAFREVTARFPAKELYDEIIAVCGDQPDKNRMRLCWLDWLKVSSNRSNTTWLLTWYAGGASGNPEKNLRQRVPVNQPPSEQASRIGKGLNW